MLRLLIVCLIFLGGCVNEIPPEVSKRIIDECVKQGGVPYIDYYPLRNSIDCNLPPTYYR